MAYFRNLRKLRVAAGMSQNRLASRAGVSRDLVSKAEQGGDCTEEKLNALLNTLNDAHYLGVRKALDAAIEITAD
jgi:transcriptional regulator with XRE-family HTH domain